ncbi:MAG: class I SAM-dependent methyltransferase [Alphaproteobacteria bacterium]|nr:class I SAM-dependent methyltransferase [Alphaproteobacteria bacterium]
MLHSEVTEEVWSDIREHARLLGDHARTDGLIAFLGRHAPGKDVLEVGCGTGMLSCVAARLGARKVLAVERTAVVEHARQLVKAAGLQDIVEVVQSDIELLEPEPMDLVFSELLNADPFAEGILDAMNAAARWVRPGGILAPHRIDLHVALIAAADADAELAEGRRAVRRLGEKYDLPVAAILDAINQSPRSRNTASWVELRSTAALAWSGDLALYRPPAACTRVTVTPTGSGRVSGAALWFAAPYDDELVLANEPQEPGHWGIFTVTWPHPIRVEKGKPVSLDVFLDDEHGVDISVAD